MKPKVQSELYGKIAGVAFFAIVGTLYAWALSMSVMAATVLNMSPLQLFALCAGFVLLLNLIFWGKYTAIGTAAIVLLCALITFIFLFLQNFEVGWFVDLRENINGIAAFARGEIPYREEFSGLVGLAVCFLFALVTVLNTRLHLGFVPLALMALGVIAMPVYMGWRHSDTAIFVMLFCILALLAKRLYLTAQRGQDKGQFGVPARYGLLLLPLCMLIFGVGWALPKPGAEAVENFSLPGVSNAMETLMHTFGPDQTMSFTNDGQRLGGPVELNDLVVMVVQAQERIYLTGAVRDLYTGHSWITTAPGWERLTPEENGVFLTDQTPENLQENLLQFTLTIDHMRGPLREVTISGMDVRTDAIFTTPFHQTQEIYPQAPVDQNVHGNLRAAGQRLPLDVSYTQTYIAWDTQSEQFSDLLRTAAQGDFDPGELAIFLQLPDTLPDRVGGLAHELTAGADNNYDRLRILEHFLASTFPYTLDTEPLPPGEDFVYHFLFTAREGYCVHYASAMVVMARTLGIPARFVEGFIMPESPAGDGRYWVTNRHAHAWVEAYFPGFGWVMFEPTAAYNLGWDNVPLEDYPVYLPTPELPIDDPYPYPETPDYDPVPEAEAHPHVQDIAKEGRTFPWVTILILLGLGGVGYLGCRKLIARYRSKQQDLEALPNREAVVALFASTLSAAQAVGCPISRSETALVYAGRTSDEPVFSNHGVDICQLAGLYSKAAYSGHEITAYERATAQGARDKVLAQLRTAPRNLPRYLVERYLLLRY